MNSVHLRPKQRSKLRISFGKKVFTSIRRLEWIFDHKKYARTFQNALLPFIIFKHQTILMRQLKDVDMWYQHNKVINLKQTIKKLSGITIHPGETFSYWKLIGKPTQKKGYVDGMVLY